MRKKIILIPGLNGRFKYSFFELMEDIAKNKGIEVKKINFKKYASKDKYQSSFREQADEVLSEVGKINPGDIIVARSLGCIPSLMIHPGASKILISPVISFGEKTEEVLNLKFSKMETRPIIMNKDLLSKKTTLIYGDSDKRIDLENLRKIQGVRKFEITGADHDPSGKEINDIIMGLI